MVAVLQERQQQLVVFRGRMPAELQESAWWLDARSQVSPCFLFVPSSCQLHDAGWCAAQEAHISPLSLH